MKQQKNFYNNFIEKHQSILKEQVKYDLIIESLFNKKEKLTEGKFIDWIKAKIRGFKNKIGKGSLKPGHIITYNYKSKLYGEGKLMFYDTFPLTMVTSVRGGYFWGFNIHYVPQHIKKQVVNFLQQQYPSEFAEKDYKYPLPGFNYDKFKLQFPFIADVMIKNYIKANATGLTVISLQEFQELAKFDTSRFIFSPESGIQSVDALYSNWIKSNTLQSRNRKVTGRV